MIGGGLGVGGGGSSYSIDVAKHKILGFVRCKELCHRCRGCGFLGWKVQEVCPWRPTT